MPSPSNVHQVPKQEYGTLENILKARLPQSGLLYNVLKLAQSLKDGAEITVQIYADEGNDLWSENTTTFMGVTNVKGLPQNLVVICGPKNGSTKETVLRLLSTLDWKRENQFEGIEVSIAPVLIEEAKKHGKLIEHDTIGLYYMHEPEALKIFTEKDLKALSNPLLRASSLEPKDAAIVEDRWPEKHEGYYEMLKTSIELCSSGGVYLAKEDSTSSSVATADSLDHDESWELVSFAVALPFGSIHAFHTEPNYRRKGYGKIAMKVLAQNVAKAGRIPLVQIYKVNDSSKSLNEGIGFKYSHDINLINFIPN